MHMMPSPTRYRSLGAAAAAVMALLAGSAAGLAAPTDPWTTTAYYRFAYRVDFSTLRTDDAERLRIWIPYPADSRHQRVHSATVESPWPYTLAVDRAGNRVLYMEGRGAPPGDLSMLFTIERAPSDGIPAAVVRTETPLDPERYRHADRLIPLNGMIGRLAEEQIQGATTDSAKVRAFYDYVVRNMRYDKGGTGWGRGDAIWACDNKRGNCTDFHSLFIAMARSQSIPARFVIGFPIPSDRDAGEIGGYHCWAEYYQAGRGWVPVDASEATKSGKHDAYFGVLPNDRIEFAAGRDLVLEPPQNGPPLNFFIYPYAEIDGKPVPAQGLRALFRFERLRADPLSAD